MSNFIKNISGIKLTNIAREYKLDYSNIIKETAKKEDIIFFDNEIKKKIIALFLSEYLNEDEKNAINNLKALLSVKIKENDIYYTIDQKDINDILILLKLIEGK